MRSNALRVCTIAPGRFDTPLLAALPEASRQALRRGNRAIPDGVRESLVVDRLDVVRPAAARLKQHGLGFRNPAEFDALELVVSMEKTFGVGVANSEVAGKALRTVNTIHDYIVEKQAEK